jgi:hypothetical protein
LGQSCGGLSPKIHLASDRRCQLVSWVLTAGHRHDVKGFNSELMITWSLRFTSRGRRTGRPRCMYEAHLALITVLGTRSPIVPLTDLRPLGELALGVLHGDLIAEEGRCTSAAMGDQCLVLGQSSLSSSRRNWARRCLICSASAFGPGLPEIGSDPIRP